ncbi:Bax inhibitor-1 family protein [Marinicrinis lubricantis]|uniref:Bax inhibitor-1 family protein n=1 Tax=Marinicrinis lubricantis TaxID=2086470 RepID=A0ABW1IUL0_9BACL
MEYRNEAYSGELERSSYNESFHKLMRMFTFSILIAFIGAYVGTMLPPAIFLPLGIVQLIMIISAFMLRKRKAVGYGFVFTFCLISGITIYPAIYHYATSAGAGIVTAAFVITVAIYAILTLYAYYSKRDFSFLGGFLMIGVLALIGFSIVGIFMPSLHTGAMGLTIAFAGVMIFSGFILYDISQYKHGVPDQMIPLAVLSLYLNFINLFLYLLQLLGILNDD